MLNFVVNTLGTTRGLSNLFGNGGISFLYVACYTPVDVSITSSTSSSFISSN